MKPPWLLGGGCGREVDERRAARVIAPPAPRSALLRGPTEGPGLAWETARRIIRGSGLHASPGTFKYRKRLN